MNDVLVSRLSRRAPMIERLAFRPDMIIGLSHRLCLFRLLSSGRGGPVVQKMSRLSQEEFEK